MPQLNLKLKRFKRETLEIADVKLSVLRLIGEEERQDYGDPVEIVARVIEEESKKDIDYILVELVSQGFKSYIGESSRRGSGLLLFPKPSQLKRIGIVRISSLKPVESSGYFKFREEDIEWFNVENNEIYIYDSEVEVAEDILFLVIDTVDGRSIVKVQRSLPPQLSYQLQPQQDQSSESSEASLNAGSNPS